MMNRQKARDDHPRFLYCPWRDGQSVRVFRHLIVKEGPKQIAVQSAQYDEFSDEFRCQKGLVTASRHRLETMGYDWKWFDGSLSPEPDDACPLGRFYRTEEGARFALDAWLSLRSSS
jgi:hypothetical protein